MTEPRRFLNRIWLFLAAAVLVAALGAEVLWNAFLHNPALNGFILAALLVGIAYSVRRILLLRPELEWIRAYQSGLIAAGDRDPPRLLAPLAAALAEQERIGQACLNPASARQFLDGIGARLDESRDIARYLTGLLIFLGLLGTFWGLLQTIRAVAEVISELQLAGRDLVGVFDELKAGLTAPLSGMGTAFSSSLFGLAGSLILGFVDLQASQAQNGFYHEVEEWISGLTRHGAGELQPARPAVTGTVLPPSQPLPAYVEALLQQTAENLERMERALERAEAGRDKFQDQLGVLAQALVALGDRLEQDRRVLSQLAEVQRQLAHRLGEEGRGLVLDEVTRRHLANIDLQLRRLCEELQRGRELTVRELRKEIKLVARTIAIAAGEPQAVAGE